MRFKSRIMLTIGCVSLLALSIPAFSKPAPHGATQKPRAQAQHANQNNKLAQHAPKGHANAKANAAAKAQLAREERAARLVSMPIAEMPQRPMLGWPALVSEARKYLGTNPTARSKLWCATFMNLVLAKVGYAGTNSDAAKSFTYYGHRVSSPEIGAIAVLSRGRFGGHVGVVTGVDKQGNPIIISGNHGARVGEAIYPRSRVIAYVMPSDRAPGTTQIAQADRGRPNHSPAEHGLDSPITELLAAIEAEQRSEQKNEPKQSADKRPPERIAQAPRPSQPIAPPRAPEPPHRVVQQTPEPIMYRAGTEPIDPRVANMLGRKDRAQAAPAPQAPPQRQRVVQQPRAGTVASASTGISGVFGLR
jgi:uncharacterized protein (TIGR02594 family)